MAAAQTSGVNLGQLAQYTARCTPSQTHISSCRSRSRSRDRRDRDRAQAGPKSLDFAARQAARGDGAMEDRPREAHPRDGRSMRADRDRDLRPSDSTRSDRGPGDSFRHRDREDRVQGRPGEGDSAARAHGASSRPIAAGNGAGLGVPMVQGGADLPAAPKKDPLSLDELLKKKQEEQAASAKVCWLAAMLLGQHQIVMVWAWG